MTQPRDDRGDVVEAELDPELLEAEQIRQGIGGDWGLGAGRGHARLLPRATECSRLACGFGRGGWRLRRDRRGPFRGAHEAERVRDGLFHLAAIDDEVQHAFLEEELAALKAFR